MGSTPPNCEKFTAPRQSFQPQIVGFQSSEDLENLILVPYSFSILPASVFACFCICLFLESQIINPASALYSTIMLLFNTVYLQMHNLRSSVCKSVWVCKPHEHDVWVYNNPNAILHDTLTLERVDICQPGTQNYCLAVDLSKQPCA